MSSEHRRLSDPRELRALSHPTRLALLELLDAEGPMTATQAGELMGESPASASFHLRTLAKYGFVEEAPGGRGRQRPWQITLETQEIREDDLSAEGKIAADAFVELLRERDSAAAAHLGADPRSTTPGAGGTRRRRCGSRSTSPRTSSTGSARRSKPRWRRTWTGR